MPRVLKADTLAFTALLATLTALGPLSTDMYLPSLPSIGAHFSASSGEAQLTLSAYLFGFAAGLPVYGPLSDRRGRKNVMLVGLVLYGIANALAAAAPSLNLLILARLLQGFGAAGPLVVARSIVRDLYDGRRAAQELARMGAIMGVVPALAPLLGAALELSLGWRSNFAASALLVVLLAAVAIQRLPETLKTPLETPFSIIAIVRGFRSLITDRRFLPYAMMSGASYSGLFAYISGSSFVFQKHFGFSPLQFALSFVVMVCGFLGGSFIAQRLAMTRDGRQLLMVGAVLQSLGGGVMVLAVLAAPEVPASLFLPVMLYSAGVGFSLPQSMAGAMMPFPDSAGSASSLVSIIQMGSAAIIGAGVGALIDHGPPVLAAAIGLCGFCSLVIAGVLVWMRPS